MKKAIAAVSGGLTYWQCYCNDRTWVRQKSDQANQKLKWKSGNSRQRWCWLKKMFTGRWWASGCSGCSLSTIGGCPRLERPSRFEEVLNMEMVNIISTLMETAVEDVARQNVPPSRCSIVHLPLSAWSDGGDCTRGSRCRSRRRSLLPELI